MSCRICDKKVTSFYLDCKNTICGKAFHAECVGMTFANFLKMSKQKKKKWNCPDCKLIQRQTIKKEVVSDSEITTEYPSTEPSVIAEANKFKLSLLEGCKIKIEKDMTSASACLPHLSESSSSPSNDTDDTESYAGDEEENQINLPVVEEFSDILECQLEEESPNADWMKNLQSYCISRESNLPVLKLNGMETPELKSNIKQPIYKRVHCVEDGSQMATPRSLMEVNISPYFVQQKSCSFSNVPINPTPTRVESLVLSLKESNYLEDPGKWLSTRYLISQKCPSCASTSRILTIDKTNFRHSVSTCNSCNKSCLVKLPAFLSSFDYPLSEMFSILFHWAVQSNFEYMSADTKLRLHKIWMFRKHLQKMCSMDVEKQLCGGSQSCKQVEVVLFQYGKFHILCAMDRVSLASRLKVLKENYSDDDLVTQLATMVSPNCLISSDSFLFEKVKKYDCTFQYVNETQLNETQPVSRQLRIVNYIKKQLHCMFHQFSSESIKAETLQLFLDELQWRERFGHHASMAFWSVFYSNGEYNLKPTALSHSYTLLFDEVSMDCNVKYVCPIEIINEVRIPITNVKSSSKGQTNVSPVPTVPNNTVDKMVLSSIPTVFLSEGHEKITISGLLSIKTWPQHTAQKAEAFTSGDLAKFRTMLISKNFFDKPEIWLVRYDFIPEKPRCKTCAGTDFVFKHSKCDEPSNWMCNSCKSTLFPFPRLKFFSTFAFPLSDLLPILFHWAAQSPYANISKDTNLNEYKIRYVYWAIQHFCSKSVFSKTPKLGKADEIVEVAVVQYGQFYIVGAMNRLTKLTLLKVLSRTLELTTSTILQVIFPWIEPSTLVATKFGHYVLKSVYKKLIDSDSTNMDCVEVSEYLEKLVLGLFGKFSLQDVKLEIVQAFLDEVVWRDRWGKNPMQALWSFLTQIADDHNDPNEKASFKLDIKIVPQITDVKSNANVKSPITEECPSSMPCLSPALWSPVVQSDDENIAGIDSGNFVNQSDETSFPVLECSSNEGECAENSDKQSVSVIDDNSESNPYSNVSGDTSDGLGCITVQRVTSGDSVVCSLSDSTCDSIKSYNSTSPPPVVQIEEPCIIEERLPDGNDSVALHVKRAKYDHCLTIQGMDTKILKPVLTDCMLQLIGGTKRKLEEKEKVEDCSVALDEYYFAICKRSRISPIEQKKIYIYNCFMCKQFVYGNINVIDHTLMHVQEKKMLGLLPHCKHCFRNFPNDEALDSHVYDVHTMKSSLSCLICSILFESSSLLNEHMAYYHVQSEMPYTCILCRFRSSVHEDVINHFRDYHVYEPHLMCPYCLKICSPNGEIDEILYTKAYCQHLMKHQNTELKFKCPSCRLSFFSESELNGHIINEHMSFSKIKGVIPFSPRLNPAIIVSNPKSSGNDKDSVIPLHVRAMQMEVNKKNISASASSFCIDQHLLGVPVVYPPVAPTEPKLPVSSNVDVSTNLQRIEIPLNTAYTCFEMPTINAVSSLNFHVKPNEAHQFSVNETSHDVSSTRHYDSEKISTDSVLDLKFDFEDSICIECSCPVDPKHYLDKMKCHCEYATHCIRAFMSHMTEEHGVAGNKKALGILGHLEQFSQCFPPEEQSGASTGQEFKSESSQQHAFDKNTLSTQERENFLRFANRKAASFTPVESNPTLFKSTRVYSRKAEKLTMTEIVGSGGFQKMMTNPVITSSSMHPAMCQVITFLNSYNQNAIHGNSGQLQDGNAMVLDPPEIPIACSQPTVSHFDSTCLSTLPAFAPPQYVSPTQVQPTPLNSQLIVFPSSDTSAQFLMENTTEPCETILPDTAVPTAVFTPVSNSEDLGPLSPTGSIVTSHQSVGINAFMTPIPLQSNQPVTVPELNPFSCEVILADQPTAICSDSEESNTTLLSDQQSSGSVQNNFSHSEMSVLGEYPPKQSEPIMQNRSTKTCVSLAQNFAEKKPVLDQPWSEDEPEFFKEDPSSEIHLKITNVTTTTDAEMILPTLDNSDEDSSDENSSHEIHMNLGSDSNS